MTTGTATVLFTDLVGSTELLSRLGDVVFDGLRRAHFDGLRQAIDRSGGTEVKTTGDGLLATFTSAVGAIGCAVAMQQTVARQSRSTGVPLAIRVGLALGDVSFEDGDVFGTPVVEAARLVVVARGGQILATAVVRFVAGGRSDACFADLGHVELKGLPAPLAICEVVWEPLSEPAVPLPSLQTGTGRIFVGRDELMEWLQQLWTEASAGLRRLVLIGGEPGVGKTRLTAEMAGQAHAKGAVVLAGRCDEDLGVPYQPFVEALRHLIVHTPTADLAALLGRYGGELVRLAPELTERLPQLPPPLRSDPETERFRLFDAVAAWLAAASAERPVLLVLDDLQWAAKPTLLLLRHVLRSADSMRLLVVGTYRDTEVGRTHPLSEVLADLRRSAAVECLSLCGLDQPAVAEYVKQAAGHELDEAAHSLARAIHAETEGNPFFISEVLRHLMETGAVHERDGRWEARRPTEELGIPEGVRDVIGRRLSRLSEGANQALTLGAVVGLEFDLATVQAACSIDEDALVSALDEAVAAHLLVEIGGPLPRHRFAHALVRSTLYDELSPARRVLLHRRVGHAIERRHGLAMDDHLAALAHHFARCSAGGGEALKAAGYARRAGDRALVQLAYDEAAGYYRQALELLDVAEPASADDDQRVELLIALGEAKHRGAKPAFRETFLQAARLAQGRGDQSALARAALMDSRGAAWSAVGTVDWEHVSVLEAALAVTGEADAATRTRLLATLGVALVFATERDPEPLVDEALALARRLDDPATLAHVLRARWITTTTLDPGGVRAAAETAELLAVAEDLGDPAIRCEAYYSEARSAMARGDVAAFDRCVDLGEQLTQELGQPVLRWRNTWLRIGQHLFAGRMDAAEQLALEARELGEMAGHPDAATYLTIQVFQIRFEQGRLGSIEVALTELARRTPGLRLLVEPMIALLYTETDRHDEARQVLELFAAHAFKRLPRGSSRTPHTYTACCSRRPPR